MTLISPAPHLDETQIRIPAIDAEGALYAVGKLEAHEKALRHQAISIFVFDGERLLIQQRAAGKYHSGLLWANTVCSHPHWGETVEAAAARRLPEELGFTTPLTKFGEITYRADVGAGLVEHEHVHLFRGEATDADPRPNPDEVAAVRWITLNDLRAEITADPMRFTPWLRIYLGGSGIDLD